MGCFLSRPRPQADQQHDTASDSIAAPAKRAKLQPLPLEQLPPLKAEDFLISKRSGELIMRRP